MTEREFCYWLQGLFEVAEPSSLDEKQTAMIRDHLKLVFTKVTPSPELPRIGTIGPSDFVRYCDQVTTGTPIKSAFPIVTC